MSYRVQNSQKKIYGRLFDLDFHNNNNQKHNKVPGNDVYLLSHFENKDVIQYNEKITTKWFQINDYNEISIIKVIRMK